MLGYISSTRKKSCRQCVKAKRRCDLGYPCCKRCFTKGLACAYPNAAVHDNEIVIRQATPDLPGLAAGPGQGAVFGSSEPPLQTLSESAPLQPSDSTSEAPTESPSEAHASERNQPPPPSNVATRQAAVNSIRRELLPEIWAPSYLNADQLIFLIGGLSSIMRTLVSSVHNLIIHRSLYSKRQSAAFDDSCSISALYLAKTPHSIPILARSIQNKITGLLIASENWSLADHLAAVQAMVVYQAIRLFDPSLRVQADADGQNPLLDSWTATLWNRSWRECLPFDSLWDRWVFFESLRRTVMVSVLVRATWSCLRRDGLCDQVPTLAKLPLNRNDRLWDMDEAEFEEKRLIYGLAIESLVPYGEWAHEWTHGDDVNGLSSFQRMLLAACRGQDDPRLVPNPGRVVITL